MFKGMEYVYAVWKEQSFSAAAKKLFITQPALSNSIKRVEDKIGLPIFDRSTSPLQLTDVGREYIHTVEQIMASQESFTHYLADTQNLKTGQITIGSGAMLSSYILPGLITSYKKKYPYVKIKVVECGEEELQGRLLDGVVDLAIENCIFPEEHFERQFFHREHLVLAVPKNWSVNRELAAWQQSIENIISGTWLSPGYPAVPLEKFRDSPFVLLCPGDDNYSRAMAICESFGFEPRAVLNLNQQLTSYNMACAGMGAAFVSDTLVKNALPNPNVVYYKLEGETAQRDICFYYKRNRYMPRCVAQFLQEAAADNLTAVGDDKKGVRRLGMDVVPQTNGLPPLDCG